MIVGTAGHIDHGKTSLVRALTGIDTDRLKEEKERGITIDLGFAYIPAGDGSILGFVDVPGHERLVHTMIAGAASIETALLVVAADDGIMPQTREHLQILNLLGVRSGVVAITKTDIVDDERVDAVAADIKAELHDTRLSHAPILRVSSTTGAGIASLKDMLIAQAARHSRSAGEREFRLAVDRCFSIPGTGTVVTGSVISGEMPSGADVTVFPSLVPARIRSIHAMDRKADFAREGDRCALNLKGPSISHNDIRRGDWILSASSTGASDRCDVSIEYLKSEEKPLKHWTPVHLHHGAKEIEARVVLLDRDQLLPGETGLAQLVLAKPLPFRRADRLILRDASAQRTIAGAVVLDAAAPQRQRRKPERLAYLQASIEPDHAKALQALLDLPPFLLNVPKLAASWGLKREGVSRIKGSAIELTGRHGAFLCSPRQLETLEKDVVAALERLHGKAASLRGHPPRSLRLEMACRLPPEEFECLIDHLVDMRRVTNREGFLSLPAHQAQISGAVLDQHARIRSLLGENQFRPPRLADLALSLKAPDQAVRKICKELARDGRIVEIAPDHFFLRSAVERMIDAAEQLSSETNGAFSTAQFRDRLGNGRQLAIQILNYLDRRGITLRKGETRRFVKRPQPTSPNPLPSW